MEFEEILKHLERRNPNVMRGDLIGCAKFIMEHPDRTEFEKKMLNNLEGGKNK